MAESSRRWLFYGRVQGVGFRATTLDLATAHPAVRGYVRNLPSGAVEVVAAGPAGSLRPFRQAIESALGRHITDLIEDQGPDPAELPDRFEIRP
jgi:acylphosphatase